MIPPAPAISPTAPLPAEFWTSRRLLLFNLILLLSFVLGVIAYLLVLDIFASTIGRPLVDGNGVVIGYDADLDGPGLCSACGALVFGMTGANVLYALTRKIEPLLNPRQSPTRSFHIWFAITIICAMTPFSISLLHLFLCLFFPGAYDHTPMRTGLP